jgi:hypothetical protein
VCRIWACGQVTAGPAGDGRGTPAGGGVALPSSLSSRSAFSSSSSSAAAAMSNANQPPNTNTASNANPTNGNSNPGNSAGTTNTAANGSGNANTNSTTPTASHLSIPATAPAGGLTITQPPQASTSFFKIASGQPITFGWNLTSLYSTPAHLTVSAYCPENNNQYSIAVLPGTATEVVWDVWSYNQANQATPLAALQYQLEIYDDRGPGAIPAGGLFSPNSALKFALYTPQPYTPLASGEWPSRWPVSHAVLTVLLPSCRMGVSGMQVRGARAGDGPPCFCSTHHNPRHLPPFRLRPHPPPRLTARGGQAAFTRTVFYSPSSMFFMGPRSYHVSPSASHRTDSLVDPPYTLP